ncbi:tetratricopeptide repeat protein [Streptomyces sp. NPDC002668]|uniref:tetratricopeptide repeat protein n=1 Tax=Streptomyces sp. NPDC002668 TaxID=3154422 RepID=UPI00331E6FF7
MTSKRPSRQELNRRRRRSGFVGRHSELIAFRDNFAHDPGSEAFQYLFHIHGHAGVGKTSLVRQWQTVARELGAATAYLDDDVHSIIEAMEAISTQFDRQGMALKKFEKQLAAYHQRLHEAGTPAEPPAPGGADSAGGAGPSSAASASSTVLAQAGLAGLGLLPGMGAVAGAMDPQQVAHGTDRLRAALSVRFRNHTDVQLVMTPVRVLTPVFLEDLAEVAERRPWVVLFLDVFERTGAVLDEWLRDVLVGEVYPGLPDNVLAVLSGQGRLDARYWGDHLDLVAQVPLDVFTEDETRQLLAAQGVTDEHVIQIILHLTGRLPVLVDTLAQNRPQDPDDVGDPSDTAVERFLKWITEPDQQSAALACALPLQLDEDIYRAAVPDTAADQYAWLRSLPFVSGQAGRCRYHDVVRTPMLRLQRTQSPIRWQLQHTSLADAYQQRRDTLESTLPPNEYWDSAAWREHRLSEIYHQLCAQPHHALPDALKDVVHACEQGAAVLRRWAQVLLQAGDDTDATVLATWGQRLQPTSPDTDDATSLINALTELLTTSELAKADRGLAHAIRGREHRNAGRYHEALTDYTSALALEPDLGRAYYGRGETHRLMKRYDEALTDFNVAIELDPNDSWNLGSRAQTYRDLERYDEALTDFNRAVELDNNADWAIASRGLTYHLVKRYDEALTDFNRAVELDNNAAWAIGSRGLTHRALERYDEALTDFNRAVELDNNAAWAIASRGQTYRALERYDEALTDFNRAIELDNNADWAIANRGETHRLMKRYDEALTDFNRAIELDNNYAWAIASRGQTYRALERYDEALTDFNRAIELDNNYAWAIANRGQTYRALERYDEALTDLNRAIELDNNADWAIANRGQTYRALERYDEALTDFNRAIELDPNDAWAIANRGETHRLTKRYDEALTDLNRAIELDNNAAWVIGNRGQTYRALERYDEALTDLNRAIELDPNDAWIHFACGVVLRLLGRPGEHDYWLQAVEILSLDVSAGGHRETDARGDLLMIYCAMHEWDKVAEQLERFLACTPSRPRIREALDDLNELEELLGVENAQLQPLRQRMESAASQDT